jgi:predicted transcriptional regulator YdeE
MNYETQDLEKKFVVGISIRTSNEKGRFQQEVPPLWAKFRTEQLKEKIPNKINDDMLAVYSEYEGDYTKPFTYSICCEVASLENVPEGMQGFEIPASSYAVFTAKGPFPQSMMQTWQAIWNSDIERLYTTDFEVYRSDFTHQNNSEIKIFIAK